MKPKLKSALVVAPLGNIPLLFVVHALACWGRAHSLKAGLQAVGCALAFGLGLLATPSRAATVIGNLTDISLEPLDTKLVFAPVTDVLVNAAGLDAGPPKVVTSTGGAFSVVLDAGDYTVSLPLVAWRKPFAISVFATNGTVNLTNLLAAPQTYTHTNNLNYTVRATPLDAAPDVLAAKLETAGGLAKLTNIAGGAATLVLSNTPPERLAPVAQTVGAAGQWFWLGSVGANRFGGGPFSTEYITLAQSGDGLSWTQLVNGPVYFEPNYYTNQNGPIAREGAIQFAEGQFWLVYNFDPYDAGGLAQGLGLACSTDLTNWSRAAVLYPFGTTNSDGVMFAATWFTDGDGSNYLVGAYGRGAVTSPKDCFVIRRLDGTFTNWSAPVTLLPHTIFKWDGALVKTGARYDLYYVNLLGGVSRATNDNLTTEFHPDYDLDSLSYGLEAPQLVALEGTGLRMYGRLAGDMYYAESTNHGDTWPPDPTLLSGLPCWHGPGILRLDQPATNLVCALGAERGLVRIDAPVLRANQFLAQDARVENGLVASDGYFLNHLRSTNLTADWLSLGFTNPPPANPGTVKAWVQISVGGQTFKVPLYQ